MEAWQVAAAVTALHTVVWAARRHQVEEPYMDEIFHVPQTQRYCR